MPNGWELLKAENVRLWAEVERLRRLLDIAVAGETWFDLYQRTEARLKALEDSMIRHFQEEHLAGDGPEIDRWKARLKAVVADLKKYGAHQGVNCGGYYGDDFSQCECGLTAALAAAQDGDSYCTVCKKYECICSAAQEKP